MMRSGRPVAALMGVVLVFSSATALVGVATALAASTTPHVTAISPKSGGTAGGTKVTVKGTGFHHVAQVLFGRTAGNHLHVKSGTRLVVHAPKHAAGSVDVRVVVSSGSTTKTSPRASADRFSFYPAPRVKALSPSKGSTAGGTVVTVSGSGFRHISAVTFGGVAGSHVVVTSTTSLRVTAPSHKAAIVDVRVDGRYGRSPTSSHDKYTFGAQTGAWTAHEDPAPSQNASNSLFDVVRPMPIRCPAAGQCVTARVYTTSDGVPHAMVNELVDGSWTTSALPLPSNADPQEEFGLDVLGLDCPSVALCVVVGDYSVTDTATKGFIDTLASSTGSLGHTWTAAEAPEPADASTGRGANAGLRDVACNSATSCVAVGDYTAAPSVLGSIVTYANGSWSASAAPLPAGGSASDSVSVGRVACHRTSLGCAAAGTYFNSDGTSTTFLLSRSGDTAFIAVDAPVPADAVTPATVEVDALSCDGANTCVAAGEYNTSNSRQTKPYLATVVGTDWTGGAAPLPADVDTSNYEGSLPSVSCAASVCVAVGHYEAQPAGLRGLVETLGAGGWTAAPAATLTGSNGDVSLFSVSCATDNSCTSVGTDGPSGLIDTLSAGTWRAISAPIPGNFASAGTLSLSAVSCAAASACAATGYYPDASNEWSEVLEYQRV